MGGLDGFHGAFSGGDLQHRRIRGAGEGRLALADRPAVGFGHVEVLLTPHRLDQVLLATHQPGHVDRARGGGDPREPGARVRGHVAGLGGRYQRLGRHAPGVHAGAAERTALDHHHRLAQRGGADRCGERRATRPDHGQINLRLHPEPSPDC